MDCFYINLDSASERRVKFESNFNTFKKPNWTLSRFSAIDAAFVRKRDVKGEASPGEKGCFLSHKSIICTNLAHDRPIFLLEDDAMFGVRTCALIDRVLGESGNPDWDILYTDVCMPHVAAMVDTLRIRRDLAVKKIEITFMNLAKTNFVGSTAYLVNGKSKQKLYGLLDAADELNIPYDLYLRGLVHISALKAFVLFPFVTSLSEFSDASQIRSASANRAQVGWNMFRKMIWMERNLADCRSDLEILRSSLTEKDMAEFGSLLSSPDKELKAFGIVFSSVAAAKAA